MFLRFTCLFFTINKKLQYLLKKLKSFKKLGAWSLALMIKIFIFYSKIIFKIN